MKRNKEPKLNLKVEHNKAIAELQHVKRSELAKLLNISIRTLQAWIHLGKLPEARLINGVRRWQVVEIQN